MRDASLAQFKRWEDSVRESLQTLAQLECLPSSFDAASTARLMCCSIQGAFLFGRVYQDERYVREMGDHFLSLLRAYKS